MKRKTIVISLIVFCILLISSYVGMKEFEKHVNNSDGAYSEYNYSGTNSDNYISISVEKKESWPKELPDDFVLDSHLDENGFSRINEAGIRECNGRTIEVTLQNISEYRINKWDIVYEVPCDMYFDKAWNGTVEISQFGGKNKDTISTKDMPISDTELEYVQVDELYLIPLKKGDKIIYHPADFEYPLIESQAADSESSKTVGLITYTEDDSFELNKFKVRYYVVKSLEEYALYSILSFAFMFFGILSLACTINLFVSVRYERMHKHDMEIISQAIGTFSKFIDSKDKYTNNHSYRVAGYSRLIAKKLNLHENECEDIYYIGLLHDTGKVVIDDKILNKPGRLTSQEYEVIKSHTTKGADLLKDFTAIKNIATGALYHHERYDGKGYPSGLVGEEIPLVARIICVADAYDAMSSNRCYRAELDKETIIDQLVSNKGKQFDPHIVDIFLKCIENGEVDSVRRSCIES